MGKLKSFLGISMIAISIKILCFPLYYSTDLEVHRNWMAITYQKPFSEWYYEETSIWTLDYPPFFAFFEYTLSHVCSWFDLSILTISAEPVTTSNTILFQRISVVCSEILLYIAVYSFEVEKEQPKYEGGWYDTRCCVPHSRFCNYWTNKVKKLEKQGFLFIVISILLSPNLLIVDSIHFQYNGMLLGLEIITITLFCQDNFVLGMFLYAALLNFKHLFVSAAPAFGIYFLRKVLCENKGIQWKTLAYTIVVTTLVFGSSLGPIMYFGAFKQLLSRLFPFGRGLCHAYWAPNFWALYNIADGFSCKVLQKLSVVGHESCITFSRGLVGAGDIHSILPEITPRVSAIQSLLAVIPMCIGLWRNPTPVNFILSVVISSLTTFLFGYHVHEKAILTVTIPFALLGFINSSYRALQVMLTFISTVSLFPLLFEPNLIAIKILILIVSVLLQIYCDHQNFSKQEFNWFETFYMLGLILLIICTEFLHPIFHVFGRLEFLPLLMTSCYCAVGVHYIWLKCYYKLFFALK